MPRREVIRFFIYLVIFSGTLSAVADTWYLISGERNLARKIAAAFPGMKIRGGKLHPPHPTPYAVPAYLVAPIINQVLGLPASSRHDADSMVVVDTSSSSPIPSKVPAILLKADKMVVVLAANNTIKFPYENVLFGTADLDFTIGELERFLKRHSPGIFFGYLVSTLIHMASLFFFSIFFLALAAFIFRVEPKRKLKEYLKVALFAVTPVAIGSTLVSISGVKLEWVWHIFILMSTVVMFRAISTIGNPGKPKEES